MTSRTPRMELSQRSTREKLAILSFAAKVGEDEWDGVEQYSESFREFGLPTDWLHATSARQLKSLVGRLINADVNLKSEEKIKRQDDMLSSLTQKRIAELEEQLSTELFDCEKLSDELCLVQSGALDDKLDDLLEKYKNGSDKKGSHGEPRTNKEITSDVPMKVSVSSHSVIDAGMAEVYGPVMTRVAHHQPVCIDKQDELVSKAPIIPIARADESELTVARFRAVSHDIQRHCHGEHTDAEPMEIGSISRSSCVKNGGIVGASIADANAEGELLNSIVGSSSAEYDHKSKHTCLSERSSSEESFKCRRWTTQARPGENTSSDTSHVGTLYVKGKVVEGHVDQTSVKTTNHLSYEDLNTHVDSSEPSELITKAEPPHGDISLASGAESRSVSACVDHDSKIRTQNCGSTPEYNFESKSEISPVNPLSSAAEENQEKNSNHKAWKKSIMILWRQIAGHRHASLFLQPVTDSIAPNYSTTVCRAMDLSTIRRDVENGVTRSTSEFLRDLMLMFQNAIMYNNEEDKVYKMSSEMQSEVIDEVAQSLVTHIMAGTDESTHSGFEDDSPPAQRGIAKATKDALVSVLMKGTRTKRGATIGGEAKSNRKNGLSNDR